MLLLSPLNRCFTLQLVDPGQGHTKSRASLKLCLYWGMADTIIEQQNRSLGCTDMQDPALHSVSLGIKPEISWASTPGMRLDLSRTTLHFHSDARTHNAWKPWVGTEVVGTFYVALMFGSLLYSLNCMLHTIEDLLSSLFTLIAQRFVSVCESLTWSLPSNAQWWW